MKLRIRFGKKGVVKFIGHLDIMRYFQKAFRRAGIDVKYSQGFHPHQNLSFASPLGLGLESTGEYLDAEMNSVYDLKQMQDDLNAQMAEGIEIFGITLLEDNAKNAMSIIAGADYLIHFREGMVPCDQETLKAMVETFVAKKEINVLKKTKKSEKIMDIRPLIYDMHMNEDGSIFMKVSAGSVNNLKPELVLSTMYIQNDLEVNEYAWLITRVDMYAQDPKVTDRVALISLGDFTY